MGLLDLFARDIVCPRCEQPGARKGIFGGLKCPNRACDHFSVALMHDREEQQRTDTRERVATSRSARRYRDPRTGKATYKELPTNFEPGQYRIEVYYRNFQDEEKTFEGDWRSLRRKGKHVSLRVRPTGTRIALAIERIQNWADVQEALGRCPTAQERRVLEYHLKRGTTSSRYEELRRRYPE